MNTRILGAIAAAAALGTVAAITLLPGDAEADKTTTIQTSKVRWEHARVIRTPDGGADLEVMWSVKTTEGLEKSELVSCSAGPLSGIPACWTSTKATFQASIGL